MAEPTERSGDAADSGNVSDTARRPNRFECAVSSRDRGDSIVATGSQVQGWLAVEVPGAWGRNAVTESALGQHVPANFVRQMGRRGLRVVCIRGRHRTGLGGDDESLMVYCCMVAKANHGPAPLWSTTIDDLAAVPALAQVLSTTEMAAGRPPGPGWEKVDRPIFLVCTNGRHDQCCAVWGRPVIRRLAETTWCNQVWESSHIGGDRFAPNMLALPHSWYFGRFEESDIDRLLTDITENRIDLRYFRGRTSRSFAEQAVEHEVRRRFGLTDDADVAIVDGPDSNLTVDAAGRRLTATVNRRLVLSDQPLTCGGRPGQRFPDFTVTLSTGSDSV